VLLGNGDGSFQAAVNYDAGAQSVAVGDFNGDGKPDLASSAAVLLGNGDGTFQAALSSSVGGDSVAVSDFNGDGKSDLAVATAGGGGEGGSPSSVSVAVGKGDGTFQAALTYFAGFGSRSVAVADFNGDGKPDLAVANVNSYNFSVFLGKGDGTFQDAVNYGDGSRPVFVAVGDFNGDGKPDIATTGFWFGNVSILLNNTPTPVQLSGVVSRKSHGSAGSFDIDLPLDGTGIECRTGGADGDYTLIFTFANTLTSVDSVSASATSPNGPQQVSSNGSIGTDPHQYIVNLGGVPNAQYVTVSLTNVADSLDHFSSLVSATMGVLLGDTNADGVVNSADITQTRRQSGNVAHADPSANFREDVTLDGVINSADITAVRRQSGTAIP